MNDDDRPVRHPAVETAEFGTEAVLYDERSGMVHHLNSSALAIWALLDGRPLRAVVGALSEASGVPPGDIRRDVLQVVTELESAGLLSG